jgi:hypothetical protein
MARCPRLSTTRRKLILSMHDHGFKPHEIANDLGLKYTTVYFVLSKDRELRLAHQETPQFEPEIVHDPDGRAVKRYPSRFAEGCGISGITAKPRGN